ncbi:acyltransferase ChoActase/COT/CPT [Geranomyces variabilis]|nr:acyltransferase ChoActase/COT/CPT [Geranomyces variabilis]KAJ3143488.1 hypothetical protein HDU90_000249 [Geranomyces variabilis]
MSAILAKTAIRNNNNNNSLLLTQQHALSRHLARRAMSAAPQSSPSQRAPRTFDLQDTLPRLPIPPLKETADRYLRTLRPLLSESQYASSAAAVAEFVKENGGLGHVLQDRLRQVDAEEPNSWLERWWLALAYHGWRESVMINSNWYMVLRDHPDGPKAGEPLLKGQFSEHQVRRAAGMASNLLNYKDGIDREEFPIDKTRAGPLDMNQYRQIFGITRVPKPGCDINVGSHPCRSKHIVVLARDQVYKVDILDSKTGDRVPVAAIEKQLAAVVKDVQQNKDTQAPIPLFTGLHRDRWAEIHKHLEDLDPVNRESFETIETAIFAISLDDYSLPHTLEDLGKNTFHAMNGHNRWFDKSISVCIMADGRTGVNGEHSPCDALIPALMCDNMVANEPAQDPANANRSAHLAPPTKLRWRTDAKIASELTAAQKAVSADIANSDIKILQYPSYGSSFMKKIAKSSPDAYMQMALQLTYYRIHGSFAPVYETASTRQYKHGRTETCRSLSVEQKEFVLAFQDAKTSASDKYAKLTAACTAHVKYLDVASKGHGVDRHLLGLRMVMKPDEKAAIFTDPAYANSSKWLLSTSGLFPGTRILGTGFGAVYPEGYGMNYMILDGQIKIGVESKRSYAPTSSTKFTETLRGALDDMARMCIAVNGDGGSADTKLHKL